MKRIIFMLAVMLAMATSAAAQTRTITVPAPLPPPRVRVAPAPPRAVVVTKQHPRHHGHKKGHRWHKRLPHPPAPRALPHP